MQIEMLADYDCVVGEGPVWHDDEQRLYWTDIETGRMYGLDPVTGQHEQFYEGREVGGMTVQADGRLLLFLDRGTVAVWDDGTLREIVPEIPDEIESRFNDVIADPEGRVFCGTVPTADRDGRLYRIDPDGSVSMVLEGIGCSNGMGFTKVLEHMYYTDSLPRRIYLFDYDRATGAIANRRVSVKTPDDEGLPDGMTLDENDDVWSARWDGWGVYRFGRDGQVKEKIDIPAKKISSVTFGGEDYADMYLTSAGGDDKQENGEHAGALWRVRGAGVKGRAEFRSRIGA